MSLNFESAKASLKKADASGVSVYDHLSDIIFHLLQEQPDDPIALFEHISAQVKARKLKPTLLEDDPTLLQDAESQAKLQAYLNKVLNQYPKVKASEDEAAEEEAEVDEGEQALEEAPAGKLPDIWSDLNVLQWANVGFASEEIVQLAMAFQKLAQRQPTIESLRFFGKIRGTKKDLYVAEAKLSEYPEAPENFEAERAEAPGSGSNEYVYYVVNYLTEEWTRLPDILPQQIVLARQMRRFVTGDLESPVPGQPRFAWNEATYVRALVGIITSDTLICPTGHFILDPENEEQPTAIRNAEYEAVASSELQSPEGWIYLRPRLLKQGRVKPFVKPEAEDEEEAATEPAEEPEEEIPLLQAMGEADGEGSQTWGFRSTPQIRGTYLHAIGVARSLKWPGAVTVAQGAKVASLYIGTGLQQLATPFSPPLPSAFGTEYVDDEEEPKLIEQEDVPPPVEEPEEAPAEE